MAINFSWTVSKADARTSPLNGLSQVIISCEWIASATDGKINLSSYGKAEFPEPDPDNFIAMNDIKQSTILGWLYSVIDKDAIEQELKVRIEQLQEPETVSVSIPRD